MLTIRIATLEEFDLVRDFYHHLIDSLRDKPHRPKWTKGIYPSDDYLKHSLIKKELFIGLLNNKVCAAMIVNQAHQSEYNNIVWPTTAFNHEVFIIHALAISPLHMRKGIGSQMIREVIKKAEIEKRKAIRLDVLADNSPAIYLYKKLNFHYVDTIQMYYPDTGWSYFKAYEYPIPTAIKN